MKVTIDVDLTPEEARKLMGLPDFEPMQKRILDQLEKQIASNLSYMDPEALMKTIMPVGTSGIEAFNNLLWGAAKTASGTKKPSSSKSD